MPRYTLDELKQLMKQNNIKSASSLNRPEIYKILDERGIIPESYRDVKREEPTNKEPNPKYEFLRYIRSKPSHVTVKDTKTGEVHEYPSIYSASKAIDCSTQTLTAYNGKVIRKQYEITIAN